MTIWRNTCPSGWSRHQVRHKRKKGRELAVSTLQKYERSVEEIIEAIGTVKIKSLNIPIIEEAIYSNDAPPHTALARYSLLVLAFRSAVIDGLIDFDHMIRIDRPFVPEAKEGVFFEPDELEKIFAAAVGTRWQYSLKIHLQLGARISELLALRESDVDYVNRTVSISKSVIFLKSHYGETKAH